MAQGLSADNVKETFCWWDIEFRDGQVRVGRWWWLLGFAPDRKDQYSLTTIGM